MKTVQEKAHERMSNAIQRSQEDVDPIIRAVRINYALGLIHAYHDCEIFTVAEWQNYSEVILKEGKENANVIKESTRD